MFADALSPLIKQFSGQVAVAFHSFRDGSSYTHNATETMRSASLIKLPLLVHALTKVARGELNLGQPVTVKAGDRVGGAGILNTLSSGLTLPLRDVLTLMIIVSDNTATNLVIELLGAKNINRFIADLGMSQTRLVGKLQLPELQQNAAQRAGEANSTCAADVLGLLTRLESRDLLPDDLTTLALDTLLKQQFTEAMARYLPTDAELHTPAIKVASKSGCLRGLWHDAGIVYDGDGTPLYALVIMTEGANDRSYSWEQEGMMVIAEVSKLIYEQRG